MLRWVLGTLSKLDWQDVAANDVAATTCLARAYRQLLAAQSLLVLGYYGEVNLVLRGVYESASTSRFLAKSPERAERWIQKREWFPERSIRDWMLDVNFNSISAAGVDDYRGFYRWLSARAHPTAVACLPLLEFDDSGPELPLEARFSEEVYGQLLHNIAALALFSCFTVLSGSKAPEMINPQWRKDLADLAAQVYGQRFPGLDREWPEDTRRQEALRRHLQDSGTDSH